MTRRRTSSALASVVLLIGLAGCSQDPFEAYCEVVAEQQEPLTEALAPGGPTALLAALPIFEELRAAAPGDIRDDWRVVTTNLSALEAALEAADVDPSEYDGENPPAGLDEAERERIEAAAIRLGSPESTAAFAAVEQQARDVCKTPLRF